MREMENLMGRSEYGEERNYNQKILPCTYEGDV
jgi:hypothetical protein